MRSHRLFSALTLAAALAVPLRAYVTSAVLEYSVDDKVSFYLNGSTILALSDFAPFNYEVLSTADGTLPMDLFKPNQDNLLAVEDHDVEGGNMSVSYRFTIHFSDGDPLVIWSDPTQSKFIHLHKDQPDPPGWILPGFDDRAWAPAARVTELKFPFFAFPLLPDPAFSGFLGGGGVPRLSHTFNMNCTTADHNLFRSHFRFPNHPAKVVALINPPQAARGQRVAVRLLPGPDTTELNQFNLLAWLPQGLTLAGAAPGYQYAPQLRRLAWSFDRRDLKVGYAHMPAVTVLSAGGWRAPEKALGPPKAGKGRRQLNTPASVWDDGAAFYANRPAWFRLAPPGVDLRQWRPLIQGVIFHSQMRLGGKNTATDTGADAVMFNYSVDGGRNAALANDVDVARMSTSDYWFDGYYDASEDRRWTWEELGQLAVRIMARARGDDDRNLLSSVVATVRYYSPAEASPWFYAVVDEPRCATLKLNTAVFHLGQGALASDSVDLPVNQALCPATPVPTPTSTPIPKREMVAPTPEPPKAESAGLALHGENRFDLGCLAVDPEPFNYAGTFVSFCVKKDVNVTLNVYSADTGKLARQMEAGAFRAGDNQFFFNAQDDQGKELAPGAYVFELVAEKNGYKEVRNATFHCSSSR